MMMRGNDVNQPPTALPSTLWNNQLSPRSRHSSKPDKLRHHAAIANKHYSTTSLVVVPLQDAPQSPLSATFDTRRAHSLRKSGRLPSLSPRKKKTHVPIKAPAFASTLASNPAKPQLVPLESISTLKTLDSLSVNLKSQAKKLEENIQPLINADYDLKWLDPVQENPPSASFELSFNSHSEPSRLTEFTGQFAIMAKNRLESQTPYNSPRRELEKEINLPAILVEWQVMCETAFPNSPLVQQAFQEARKNLLQTWSLNSVELPRSLPSMEKPSLVMPLPSHSPSRPEPDPVESVDRSTMSSRPKSIEIVAPVPSESVGTLSTNTNSAYSQANDSKRQSSSTKSSTCTSTITVFGLSGMPLGPLERFASRERLLTDQILALTDRERNCLALLRQHWDADHPPMPSYMYLRFARFCQFDVRKGRRHLSKFDERYLTLTAVRLESQLLTQTLYPVPDLKSLHGHDMFYMRPALFNSQTMKTQIILDNLAYVMLSMVEREQAATHGIGFIADMSDWTMENFSVDYCRQFMKMLQGGVPARVCLFLIVNPPSWFGKIWRIMKPMLHPNFRKQVKMIPEQLLHLYLAMGYQAFLPNDMETGSANSNLLVHDFIAYRKHVEEKKGKPTDL